MNDIIVFKNVRKHYPYYHHITAGIKNFLFNFPKAIREMRTHKFTALEDISFTIKKGESVGFIGRNGAGKSTILSLIAQVLSPNEGSVTVNGRISPLLELGGGFHPELTGLENINLNGVLLGLTRKEVQAKVQEIIDFSELGDFIHQPLRTYSSGMMARLGFSVVASLDPEILLVDEVLAVGDIQFQEKCLRKMVEFRNKGISIVIVSHSTRDIEHICDRTIWIDDHKVKMDGPTNVVLEEYCKFFEVTEGMANQH